MDPHEITVYVALKSSALTSVPGKKDQVAISTRVFLDVANFALAEAITEIQQRIL